jgi:5-(carboxyamino)imidazole ribonucleotide synthase
MKVGILGAGQLGRMLALAGYPLGLRFAFLDHAADACAGQVAPLTVGEFEPRSVDAFAAGCDVLTFDWENVPVAALAGTARAKLAPAPLALETAQDRLVEKDFLRGLGIPTPEYRAVGSMLELEAAAQALGYPAVLKTRRLGYDGKGQRVLRSAIDLGAAWEALEGTPLILEAFVPFDRELSLLAVRGRDGTFRAWPLVENVHRGGILHSSVAPAGTPELQAAAEAQVRALMERLGYVGVLALEYFDLGGRLLANEFAPRVHNSGHWTIEGAVTSQFENHLRAVCGLPLGDTAARGHAAMLNLVGALPARERLLALPGVALHDYGKAPRPGRKVGHATVVAADRAGARARLAELERLLDPA